MTLPSETEVNTSQTALDESGVRHGRPHQDRILVVDDEPEIRRLVQEILEDEHYQVMTAKNAAEAREHYRDQRPDLVLLDIWMPDTDGISLLKEWSESGRLDIPIIMMSGHGTVETAVEATRLGAYDFIEKPVSLGKLLVTIERALESEVLRRENLRLRDQVEPPAFLVGKSEIMRKLREDIERVATTDSWVLIIGEQGNGKAQAARFLHGHSARREQPIIEISLAAVTSQDISLRLFGSEADGTVAAGSFEQANGGTLVLSEIGELDSSSQAQLLNVLEEKKFLRTGGRHSVSVDVRIIALTSQDLQKAAREGSFREDLYYRLNVVPLHIPPLREHREDVPELVNFYLDWLVDHEQLPYCRFTIAALNALRNHYWPGNIRELKNVVQRLLILNRSSEITETEVEQALGGQPQAPSFTGPVPSALFELPLRSARDQFEKAYLEYHLGRTGGNVAEVARLSEMERTHLYRKLKHLGVNPKALKD